MSFYDPSTPDHLQPPVERELAHFLGTMTAFVRGSFVLKPLPELLDSIEQLRQDAVSAKTISKKNGYLSTLAIDAALAAYCVIVEAGADSINESMDDLCNKVCERARALSRDEQPTQLTIPSISELPWHDAVEGLIDLSAKAIAMSAV